MAILPNLETRRSTIRQISEEIHQLSKEGQKLFLFAGAGVSTGSSLPNWKEFIAGCVSTSFGTKASVEELAEVHRVDHGSVWLVDVAKRLQKTKDDKFKLLHTALWGDSPATVYPSTLHYLLVRVAHLLDCPVVTTNYDNLLEIAAHEMGVPVKSVFRSKDIKSCLEQTSKLKFSIIHLHGLIPKKLDGPKKHPVASQLDYYDAFNANDETHKLLKNLLKSRRGIFIGTSMSDTNINRCLHATAEQKPKHLWFTTLNANTFYARKLHEDFWQHLDVTPVYCSPDYREIPAILRRVSDQIHHPIVETNEAKLKDLKKRLDVFYESVIKIPDFQRCLNPWDIYEIDFYLDRSDDYHLKMDRVWHSPRSDESKAASREFKLEWRCSEVLKHAQEAAVPDAIDCLCPHYLIRSKESTVESSEVSGGYQPLRSSGFITFPIFVPMLGRAGCLLVLKYVNADNWLAHNKTSIGFSKEVSNNINKLDLIFKELLNVQSRVKNVK